MARPLSLLCGVAGLLLGLAGAAHAMTVEVLPAPGGEGGGALLLQGRIVPGDAARLRRALSGGSPRALVLNSPGGSVLEARDMARLIRAASVRVVVPNRAVCASACFLLFAAGGDKSVEPGAMVGVHSASVAGGNETMDTLGVTTLMAREAAAYGVPAAITGRMVTTSPGQMAWLSRAELEGMGARVASTGAAAGAPVLPGSGEGSRSDWTRGFERGQRAGPGGDCAPPAETANAADYRLGCASGQRAGSARVASDIAGKSDWTRGFEYGRARGGRADCDAPDAEVADRRDWSLGCGSGRRASGS